ncbi:MAG: hypothetical protein L3J82_10560, partial [Planctomycetes bacterium]|nr:hypothetical protein [Planctomycetota bacterium]
TGIAEVVGEDSSRAKVVDNVVREATEFLTKNLSARLNNPELSEPAEKKALKKKPAKKKATKKKPASKKKAKAAPEADFKPDTESPEKPKRKRAIRKKKEPVASGAEAEAPAPKRKKATRKSKAELALGQAKDTELSADSDRLDYLTDEEGQQLSEGQAPSKRSRKLNIEA